MRFSTSGENGYSSSSACTSAGLLSTRYRERPGRRPVETPWRNWHREPQLETSVFGEGVVGIAVQPPLAGLGGRNDWMTTRTGVFRSVLVGRIVAAERSAAFLAG